MINWKVRFRNKVFLVQLFLAIFVPVLAYYGMTAKDLTTWGLFFNLLGNAFSNPYVIFTIIISVMNAINDPTTKGISDSQRAMTYNEPK